MARLYSAEVLTLALGWAALTANVLLLSVPFLAGWVAVYTSFQTPMLGYAWVVYVTVVAPLMLAMTAIRFIRSALDTGNLAAWLGFLGCTATLAVWLWSVIGP